MTNLVSNEGQRVHVNCLYAIHRRRHVILEGEPLNVDIHNLTGFKIHATYARSSILEFGAVVRNKEGGFAKPGEVADDLGIHDDEAGNESRSRASTWPLDDHDGKFETKAPRSSGEVERRSRLTIPLHFCV